MTAVELVTQLRELYLHSNIDLVALRDATLVDEAIDTANLVAPFTIYDIEYDYATDESVIGGRVIPLRVIRYGVAPGCSAPSITVMGLTSRYRSVTFELNAQWGSTLGMYYLSVECAQAELDYQIKVGQKHRAQAQLNSLLDEYLCVLINSVDVAVLDSQLSSLTLSN